MSQTEETRRALGAVSGGQLTDVWEHIYDIHAFDDFSRRAR